MPVSEIRNMRQKVLFFVFVLKTLMAKISKVYSLGGCCRIVACCTTFFWFVADVQSKWNSRQCGYIGTWLHEAPSFKYGVFVYHV